MLSATGITAALAILAIAASVVDTDTPVPPGAEAATHVVAADGSGDFSTIGAAVDAAADGDTILVRPGTYTESVTIEKDITLTGDGPREDIVLVAPEDGPTVLIQEGGLAADPYAVLLQDTLATVSGLTLRGQPSEVIASGGAPTVQNIHFDVTGYPYEGGTTSPAGSSIVVNGDSAAVIRENTITGGGPIGVFDGSDPIIEGNTLSGGPHIFGFGFGEGSVVRNNTIEGTIIRAIGTFRSSEALLIEGNTISDPGTYGIDASAGDATIIGNTITDAGQYGISISSGREAIVRDNVIRDNRIGLAWSLGEGSIEGNVLTGGDAGLIITDGAPSVSDNVIEDVDGRGLVVGSGTAPVLTGNRSCDNGENLVVQEGSEAIIDDTNEICEDVAPAE